MKELTAEAIKQAGEGKILECSNTIYFLALRITEGTGVTVQVNHYMPRDHWIIR